MNPIFSDQSEEKPSVQNLNILASKFPHHEARLAMKWHVWWFSTYIVTRSSCMYQECVASYITALSNYFACSGSLTLSMCWILKVTIERLPFHIQSSSLTSADDDGACVVMRKYVYLLRCKRDWVLNGWVDNDAHFNIFTNATFFYFLSFDSFTSDMATQFTQFMLQKSKVMCTCRSKSSH
jgi:hypothetical protein